MNIIRGLVFASALSLLPACALAPTTETDAAPVEHVRAAVPSAAAAARDVCGGCKVDGDPLQCRPGYDLDACGQDGSTCAACGYEQTCVTGSCTTAKSVCVATLEAAGNMGAACLIDGDCKAGAWCEAACCDPVVHTCFVVNRCVPQRPTGAHCDHVGGDHECLSGTCDPTPDMCL